MTERFKRQQIVSVPNVGRYPLQTVYMLSLTQSIVPACHDTKILACLPWLHGV